MSRPTPEYGAPWLPITSSQQTASTWICPDCDTVNASGSDCIVCNRRR